MSSKLGHKGASNRPKLFNFIHAIELEPISHDIHMIYIVLYMPTYTRELGLFTNQIHNLFFYICTYRHIEDLLSPMNIVIRLIDLTKLHHHYIILYIQLQLLSSILWNISHSLL